MRSSSISSSIKTLFILLLFSTNYSIAQDYYPLEIGNRWDYERTYTEWGNPQVIDTFSVEVIGDLLFPNGHQYYALNRSDLTGGIFVRADSSNIYYYDENEIEEDTLYRLNAAVGEEWYLQFGVTTMIRLDSIGFSHIFNFDTKLNYYRLDGLILGYTVLSDKFGLVQFHSPGEPPGTSSTGIRLLGCIIDSVEYGTPVSVENHSNKQPNTFSLSQNYPNPFNPGTIINFSIPEMEYVSIIIYDVLGNEVKTLVNEEISAGRHQVSFDAKGLSSGIYFYQLKSKYSTLSKKMIYSK